MHGLIAFENIQKIVSISSPKQEQMAEGKKKKRLQLYHYLCMYFIRQCYFNFSQIIVLCF